MVKLGLMRFREVKRLNFMLEEILEFPNEPTHFIAKWNFQAFLSIDNHLHCCLRFDQQSIIVQRELKREENLSQRR